MSNKEKKKERKKIEKEIHRLQKRLEKMDRDTEEEFKEWSDSGIHSRVLDEEDRVIFPDKFPFNEDKKNKTRPPRPPKPPKAGMPPMPPHPAQPHRRAHIVRISDEQREKIKLAKIKAQKERERLRKEVDKMRKELRENERELRKNQTALREGKRRLREKMRRLREKQYQSKATWDIDIDEDIESVTADLEVHLGDYTKSILASVAESLKKSMGVAVSGASDIGVELGKAGVEIGKLGKEIGKEIATEYKFKTSGIGPSVPEEKLEDFYKVGATIVASIGDPNRLRILKELEKGPKYQKELSDLTNLKGGTFKHHMDRLQEEEVKFVTQEVVRGRYLLTTRGREALKLAEMLYLRHLQEKAQDSDSKEFDVDIQ